MRHCADGGVRLSYPLQTARLGATRGLGIGEVTWELASGVWMRSLVQDQPIKEASAFALRGEGSGSAEEATHLGERWRDALETAFARLGVGADFGEQGPRSYLSEAGMRWLEHQNGSPRVLNDEPGLSVFSLHPPPTFVGGSGDRLPPPTGACCASNQSATTRSPVPMPCTPSPHPSPPRPAPVSPACAWASSAATPCSPLCRCSNSTPTASPTKISAR